jgi:hypothetical protein
MATAFQASAFQNNAFQIDAAAAAAAVVGNDGDGPARGSKRRRYRYNEWFNEGQALELQRRLQALRERQKKKEDELEEQALAALEKELEAQILAMLMAWPEEQAPTIPEPYRAPPELINAFGFGQTVSDQARMAEIVQQMEMVARQVAEEQQRLREQDDEEAMMLLQ